MPRAFDVVILYLHRTISCLHVDFECLKLALCPTFLTHSDDKHDKRSAIALRLPSWLKLTILCESHDFLTFLTTRLPISRFLVKYHSEIKCFFVQSKRKCLPLLNRTVILRRQQETSRRFCAHVLH